MSHVTSHLLIGPFTDHFESVIGGAVIGAEADEHPGPAGLDLALGRFVSAQDDL